MKLVTRNDFLKMPKGTIFMRHEDNYFDAPCIKAETVVDEQGVAYDYYFRLMLPVNARNNLREPISAPDHLCREGDARYGVKYGVFEQSDREQLAFLLNWPERAVA